MELRAIEGIYISEGIKYLNVSEMSIEEISTRVLQMTGLKRRIGWYCHYIIKRHIDDAL